MNLESVVSAQQDSEHAALIHSGGSVSYGELISEASRVQRGLVALGVEPGDRVGLLAGTTPSFVMSLFGILRAGAVAVPMNPLAPAPEIARELDVIEAKALMVGPAASAVPGMDVGVPVVALDGASIDGAIAFADFGAGGEDLACVDREDDDLALLLFTSGTAGDPKAAMLTHGNLLASIDQVDQHSGSAAAAGDVTLAVLPLFHILGLNVVLAAALNVGASVVLVERFDPHATADLVRQHGVTVIAGPPAMWKSWAETPDIDPADFTSVRLAVSGAAPLTSTTATLVRDRLGVAVEQGYGLTEAAPALTMAHGTGAPVTSVGRPVPGVRLRLVNARGEDVPVGDEGEVWAKGANIFAGYWRNQEATDRALTEDGWLRTGDVAVVDQDGFLYIVNRTKDLILVSGFNVYPREVERIIRQHPDVIDAGVVGIEDARTGEAVRAVVIQRTDAGLTAEDLITHCRERLASYKCPSVVDFVDELPRGPVGKLRRRELR